MTTPRHLSINRWLGRAIVPVLALSFVTGCVTFIPVATEEAMISYQGKGLTVAREGLTLSVIPRRNPSGLGRDFSTFELVAENTTDDRLRMMLADTMLFNSRGEQYHLADPEMLPAVVVTRSYQPVFGWHGYHGRRGYYRHGGLIHVPVTTVRRTRVQDRGFQIAEQEIYPGALVRGNLYFPCGKRDIYSMRLLITRLVRDENRDVTIERLDGGDEIRRTPVREVPYEFEFRLVRE